ncbi:hypothetical protein ACFLRP_05190 [Bacteroidota bacterium]
MIRVKLIRRIIELAIWSAYIKGEQPVSVLLTAPVEAGKTEILMLFSENQGVVLLTDATAFGIIRDYGDVITNKQVRHLIFPDLIKPLSRGKETVHGFIAFLNSIVEEGLLRVSTYATTVAPPEQSSDIGTPPKPVKCGIIAALAKEVLKDGRHQWSQMGFMSRMIPVSYRYATDTQIIIRRSISKRKYIADKKVELQLPDNDIEVTLERKQAKELEALAADLVAIFKTSVNAERIYGFRLQKQLQRLAMANALRKGRDTVTNKDVELIYKLSNIINLDYYPL